jgi:membrane protein implicated in regulation of membrane protease activity
MKFPQIDKTLAQTLFWAIPVAAVIMLFLGLTFAISWWLAFIIIYGLTVLFLHPVVKETTTSYGHDIDIGDITETALDMLLEDEDETNKKITLDDSIDY